MGTLYIVSTPIGNLQDLSLRAAKTLQEVDAIACEDTRRAGILLKFIRENPQLNHGHAELDLAPSEIPKQVRDDRRPFLSYYEQNEYKRIPEIMTFLKNGRNIALISDAGTPTISDPGFKLVRECVKEGIKVEAIPGPSSVITSLVISGLPTDKFLFLGYPPRKEGKRIKMFESLASMIQIIKATIIIFESPHRLLQTLGSLKSTFGDIDIVVCRELTKLHEEIRRELVSGSIEHFSKVSPKGEFVILFNLSS